jgi:hypothetical protein
VTRLAFPEELIEITFKRLLFVRIARSRPNGSAGVVARSGCHARWRDRS